VLGAKRTCTWGAPAAEHVCPASPARSCGGICSVNPSARRRAKSAPIYGSLNIRCLGTCPNVAVVRQRIGAVHPEIVISDANPLEDVYFEQLAQPRAVAALGFTFAAIAVLAAAAGLFSVLTYAVGGRKREFGIRSALGASPAQIQTLVIHDGLLVAFAGVAIGVVAAWSLARVIASFQYGVSLSDPISWAVVVGVIGVTTIAASWCPARAAMRANPFLLLKEE
jgi:putative ABC transport system permease protein